MSACIIAPWRVPCCRPHLNLPTSQKPTSYTIILEVRVSTYEFWGGGDTQMFSPSQTSNCLHPQFFLSPKFLLPRITSHINHLYACSITQLCPNLCNPMDYHLPSSFVHEGFPRQEHWSGLPFPSRGDLSNPGIEPRSPELHTDSLPLSHQGRPTPPTSVF